MKYEMEKEKEKGFHSFAIFYFEKNLELLRLMARVLINPCIWTGFGGERFLPS